ncbi:hypothetical protein AB4Z13_00040 [Rhizobium sp. YAF28]|uniref:hypothetical protein n=1 Tax=Rhizobium sp. YAF28 TaxID=3233081 RepID=UPI003F9902C0
MDSMQDNNALSRKRDQKAAATASSIIQSSDENPDEVAGNLSFARKFSETTGKPVSPQMITGNRELLQGIIDAERNRLILSISPRTATWLSENPTAAVLAKDDIYNLGSFEKLAQKLGQVPKAFGEPNDPAAKLNARASRPVGPSTGPTAPNWPPVNQIPPTTAPFITTFTLPVAPTLEPSAPAIENGSSETPSTTPAAGPVAQAPSTGVPPPSTLQSTPSVTGSAPETSMLQGWENALIRGLIKQKQKYHTFMLDFTADPAGDRTMPFWQIVDSERAVFHTRSRDIKEWIGPDALFHAAVRYSSARIMDFMITDEDAAARHYLEALAEDIAAVKALPKSSRAASVEKSINVEGASFPQTLMNAGSAVWNDPVGALSMTAENTIEDLPQAVPGIVAGAVTKDPRIVFAADAVTNYLDEYLTAQADYFEEIGIDISKPEDRERVLKDPSILKAARERAVSRANALFLVDTLSGGLFEKLGIKKPFREAAADTLREMITAGAGELFARLASGQKIDWGAIVTETMNPIAIAPKKFGDATRESVSNHNQAITSAGTSPAPTTPATPVPVAPAASAPTTTASSTTPAAASTTPAAAAPIPTGPAAHAAQGAAAPVPKAAPAATAPAATAPAAQGVAAPTADPATPAALASTSNTSATPATAPTTRSARTPKTDRIKIQGISKASESSSFRRRSPEDFHKLAEAYLEGTSLQTLYIPIDNFAKQLKATGTDLHSFAANTRGMSVHDLDVSLATGSAVKIPTATYATDYAGGNLDGIFQENSSFDPHTPTAAEAKSPQPATQRNNFNPRGERIAPYRNAIDHTTRRLIERDLAARIRKNIADTNAVSESGKDHAPVTPVLKKTGRIGNSGNTKRYPAGLSLKSPTDQP